MNTMDSVIALKVRLEAGLKQDGNQWIACCAPLDIFTQGDSREGAKEALAEAVEAWFESSIKRGVLVEALRECGFVQAGAEEPVSAHIKHVIEASDQAICAGFMPDFIELSVPAYIAAHQL